MMNNHKLKVFSGQANPELARSIAERLGDRLGRILVNRFPDGEIKVQIEEDVRGRDIFLVQPTCPPVNENLMELLVMLDAFKRASAARITAVIPYYGYARQDRKDMGRVPITAKLVANLISGAGADRVLAMDLHAAQIQGFFDIPVDHLHASPVICEHVRKLDIAPEDFVILSPDVGNIKKATTYQKKLGGQIAIIDKRRTGDASVQSSHLIGSTLKDKVAVIFDDMISTAGTVSEASREARRHGARAVYICATHAVLCGPAIQRLREAAVEKIVITDTIPTPREKEMGNMLILSVAPLLADAIRRIHMNESVSYLFE
jgi:ribose-phosphate pyrophosphokinase